MRIVNKINQELVQNLPVKADEEVGVEDLVSNDIFCIVYIVLNLCNNDFSECYEFNPAYSQSLVRFNRKMFLEVVSGFFFHISHDSELVWVFKQLLCLGKFRTGN